MSLRKFHIAFIVLSIALLFWFGYWQKTVNHRSDFAAFSVIAGVLLTAYFFWFISKIKKGPQS